MTQLLPYKWSCGCGEVELELTSQPFLHAHCFCDDCRARLKVRCSRTRQSCACAWPPKAPPPPAQVASSKEKEAGKYNRLTGEGGLNTAAWWGSQCKLAKGKDKLRFFRAALHEGGESANATTRTVTAVASCCGTLAYHVPPSPGFVHVYLGPKGERLLPACGSWLCAPAFPPVDVKMMTSFCSTHGIAPPPNGHPLIPFKLACKYVAASAPRPGRPGRGNAPHVQRCAVGAKSHMGKPVEYIGAEAVTAIQLPKPQIAPW